MRSSFRVIIFLLLLIGTVQNNFAQKLDVQKSSTTGETVLVKEAIKNFDNALIAGNVNDLNARVSEKLFMKHSNGLVETKQTLLDHIESGYLKYDKIILEGEPEIKSDNNKTSVYEDAKLVSRNINVSGTLNEKKFDVKLIVSERWILKNNHWLLIRRESKKRD